MGPIWAVVIAGAVLPVFLPVFPFLRRLRNSLQNRKLFLHLQQETNRDADEVFR